MGNHRAFRPGFWLAGLLTLSGGASGQVVEAWVARYRGPVDSAQAYAMAIDATGFIYVTGGSRGVGTGYDYATIKYDSDGNEVWVARYDGPVHDNDFAYAIAVDDEGNVYVTGASWGQTGGEDIVTIKYDSDGNELWVARYDEGRREFGYQIAVDAQGSVYVTGTSEFLDGLTLKYDADGNLLWVARISSGEPVRRGFAIGLGLDSKGNVYVTGIITFGPTYYDQIVTLKYDSDGNELWRAFYSDVENGNDDPHGMQVDSAGNVFVTGEATPERYIRACVTIKYDTDGKQIWAALYRGSPYGDVGNGLAVDEDGNVYVAGASAGLTSGWDYLTLKYDSDGNQVWVAIYDGPAHYHDSAGPIVLDSDKNVYVTGGSTGVNGFFGYATVKYDQDGNEIWVARYDGPAQYDNSAGALALDLKGNIYVTGRSYNWDLPHTTDYATIKYSPK